LIFGFGCSSEPEKFNPPLSSYQAGFYTYSDGSVTLKVKGAAVTADFMKGSRITPMLGRGFQDSEFGGSAIRTMLMSKAFWASHLKSDASAIGKTVSLDGSQYIVVGIMPDSINVPEGAQIWIPK
jgi:putative ABC transport system permease protein